MPPYVGLSPRMQHRPYNSGDPGFLGPAHAPFQPNGDGKDDMVLQGITLDRLHDRKSCSAFDNFNRRDRAHGMMDGMDAFQQQAFGVLTSSKLAEALDSAKNPSAPRSVRLRHGDNIRATAQPRLMQQFLHRPTAGRGRRAW